MEYQAGKLEQENQELLTSLKELREAGSSSSLSKLKTSSKVSSRCTRSVQQISGLKKLNGTQWDEMTRKLNDYSS
ncbi:uncharacterized protein At4g38062-like [Durio zibethinus]|uniref:Uncharacterized protein At4g38062-like n=1 Tax=Durio zibethinus TaxID=66656 RepID=A0A6P6BD34_DURZI|nr:uncharacterized protein At4g38062-like [Durio zibethinus]